MADSDTDDAWESVDPVAEGLTPSAEGTKFPKPQATGNKVLDKKLLDAWSEHMQKGFQRSEELYSKTLVAYMTAYDTTLTMNKVLFIVGIGLFLCAVALSVFTREWQFGLIFGGLGLGLFLAYFISRPMQALEENQEFIAWLGVAYNTYWSRLMYAQNQDTILADIKAAGDDFSAGIQKLIEKHAELRQQRPAGNIGDK